MVEPDQQKASFWSTLPGVLTGVATLITAVAAVIAIFVGHDGSPAASTASPSSPGASASSSGADAASSTTPPAAPSSPSPSHEREAWPPYPGPAAVGDSGPAALGWQEILIQCGAISDIPENRDGVYGEVTGEKVEQLESHWGWLDADTTADRLTYNHIVKVGCA